MAKRWHLRFDNYSRALALLEEAMTALRDTGLSDLEQAGTVQRYEFCWELAWKTMRDFLFEVGAAVDVPVPINIIRAAMQANLITDGDGWVAAMQTRNMLSHEYNSVRAMEALQRIATEFLPLFVGLRAELDKEFAKGN